MKQNYVRRARKWWGPCDKCGEPIREGDSYAWVSIRTSTYTSERKRRHLGCPDWRQSELTGSSLQPVFEGIESMEDALGEAQTVSDLRGMANEFATNIEVFIEDSETKLRNLISGFGHPTASSRLQTERVQEAEHWVEQIRMFSAELDAEPYCPICAGTGRCEPDDEGSIEDDGMIPCVVCDQTGTAPEGSDALSEYVRIKSDELQELINDIPFD